MVKKLKNSYDISRKNMLDMEKHQAIAGFKLFGAEFGIGPGKNVKKKVLKSESDDGSKQIFSMKDGLFILEIEKIEENYCQYYCSNNLIELYTYNGKV